MLSRYVAAEFLLLVQEITIDDTQTKIRLVSTG